MTKEEKIRKSNIDEMAGKLFDYINAACDETEADRRMMEVALGFITATLDMNKPLEELKIELQNKMVYSYMFARKEVEKFKAGNNENVVSESRREE
jgi:hypothetical protein